MTKYMRVLLAGVLTGLTTMAFAQQPQQYRKELLHRFLAYTQIASQGDNNAEWMTPGQEEMAQALYEEVQAFGFPTHFSKDKYIYVHIPSNLNRPAPVLGLSAHYDTTPDIIGYGIKPQVIENYDGKPIVLKNGHVIDFKSDPYLQAMIGKTVITSDGTTMLSGDDKAGVAVLVTLLKTLADNPSIPHGPIQVVITPNEDVGRSAERLELAYYNPDYAFDFDAGGGDEVIVGNFSAYGVVVTVKGINGHQSYAATNGYRNSPMPIAFIIDHVVNTGNLPNHSTGEDGYIEPHHITYDAENNTHSIDFRLRSFSKEEMTQWLAKIDKAILAAMVKYDVMIEKKVTKQYENVADGVKPEMLDIIDKAMHRAGIIPRYVKERAGTTSAMIMAKHGFGGYTVFTGQNNPHAFTEWVGEEDLYNSYRVALNLVSETANLPAAQK